jgi:hypothetical protein
MGVAVGDFDNDGWVDLYVTNFGRNALWRNRGDGTFEEVTEAAGVAEPRWSTSAAFVDFDGDGWLDLFVANYTEFSLANNRICYAPNSARDYCSPSQFDHVPDVLWRNRGDGTFEDVSAAAGIDREARAGLGVVVADFNLDGRPDIYVANDGVPNQMWLNAGDGRFRNEALLAGTAVNMEGRPEASMGVDAGDFDADGDPDLFMTHIQGETNTIYVNDGQGWFEDRTLIMGLGASSKPYTAFGTVWFDYDNDGWLDLFVANGEVRVVPILMREGEKYPLHQPNQLFRNRGDGQFEEVTERVGAVMALSEVSRGVAVGDVDNDGDADVLVVNNSGPARLLVNRRGNWNHWLGLRLVDRHGRDALGARVQVVSGEGPSQWRRVRSDGSYLSANDPRVLIGLGSSPDLERVRVYWPGGRVEEWTDLAADRYYTLRSGRGDEVRPEPGPEPGEGDAP